MVIYFCPVGFRGKRGAMGWQGAGRRFMRGGWRRLTARRLPLLRAALLSVAFVGCAESAAEETPAVSSAIASTIVQSTIVPSTMAPSVGSATGSGSLSGAAATSTGAAGERASASGAASAGVRGASPAPDRQVTERVVQRLSPVVQAGAEERGARASAATVRGSETITPRHLEAELNRLEAELAN